MKKIYIKEKKVNYDIKKYLKPEYIYIPIKDNYKIYVKENDYIKKNSIVAKCSKTKIVSPISGMIRGYTYKYLHTGKKEKCLIIENDFKEKIERKNIKENSKYLLFNNTTKYIIINGIDSGPYSFIKRCIINNYTNKLLEYLDNSATKKKIYICIANNDINSYNIINKYLGTYPNMEIIRIDNYIMAYNNLIKEVFGYNKKSVEIFDIISLYEKYNKNNYNECLITINGINIKVKAYTLLEDVISYLNISKKDSLTINGLLEGTSFNSDDIVIDKNIKSVFTTRKRKAYKESKCVSCGKCLKVCPVRLAPVYIMNNINNKKILKKLNYEKCIECGLCSYICPSNINLKEYIKKAKENTYE